MRNPAAVRVTMEYGVNPYDGDECLDGFVGVVDEDGEDIGTVYGPMAPGRARKLGERMARDRNLELVIE